MTREGDRTVLPAEWADLYRFKGHYGLSDPLAWLGISARSAPNRLQRTTSTKAALKAIERLRAIDASQLGHVAVAAEINARQAQETFRSTIIGNISGPAAVLFGIGQMFPEASAELIRELEAQRLNVFVMLLLVGLILTTVVHAWMRARDACDLRDIAALVLAERAAEATRAP